MSLKPWHFVFFIFNSYSHTHSNLKRASSIPKLFFFSHIFFNSLIRNYFTSILYFIQIHEFETLSFFFLHAFFFFFFFQARVRFPSFFSLFCSYVLHYNLHTSHALKTWVRLPGLFFTHFLLHVLASSIILLTFKIFFTTRFFFPFIHYSIIIFFFIPFYHSHK